jgi:hypothetical protein
MASTHLLDPRTSWGARFLLAGLVVLLLGTALTEQQRRSPPEAPKHADPATAASATPPGVPSTKALLETADRGADDGLDPATLSLQPLLSKQQAEGFTFVLDGKFGGSALVAGGEGAVFVMEKDAHFALVKAAVGAAPVVLALRQSAINSVSVDGETVYFAEGPRVLSVPLAGGPVTVRARFARGVVNSLAAKHDVVVATLLPKDVDPFSTDPSGAVVKVEADGTVAVVAGEQVRPRDLTTDGVSAWWLAGYPAGLSRGTLDGQAQAQLAPRADGPLVLDGDDVVFRFPERSSPELRRVKRTGGGLATIVHGDFDQVAVEGGLARVTSVGIGARLSQVPTAGGELKDVLPFKGTARGLAVSGGHTWFLVSDDAGRTTLEVGP